MFLLIFRKILVLSICFPVAVFSQETGNKASVSIGETEFLIERPFVITVAIPDANTRPVLTFPDIPGFSKKGTSASITTIEVSGRQVVSQVITQSYQARQPGRYQLSPFVLTINDADVPVDGAELIVLAPPAASAPGSNTLTAVPKNAAFLQLRTDKTALYAGEGLGLTLSFFVADNYPYVLNFTALEKQLQAITKQIRPVNAWEENWNITDLKPVPVLIGGKKFREYRLYQAVFFSLVARTLTFPAVSLQLTRQPVNGPSTTQPESIGFSSQPVGVLVRALPPHPLRGQVPVGLFRLEENLSKGRVEAGQSVRYTFAVAGAGNIATLTPPTLSDSSDVDIFPPEERQTINRINGQISGRKAFSYFLVPHQNGTVPLVSRFRWIYFDPLRARYDTLRPRLSLRVGGPAETGMDTALASRLASQSLYAGIDRLDSSEQPLAVTDLVRVLANTLIILMLAGMIYIFLKK